MILAVIVVVATAETARVPRSTASTEDQPKARAERPPTLPWGSNTSMPPVGAPSVPSATVSQPCAGIYKPPPINSFSDRVIQCAYSFPLNGPGE